jgi:hypothetical protein
MLTIDDLIHEAEAQRGFRMTGLKKSTVVGSAKDEDDAMQEDERRIMAVVDQLRGADDETRKRALIELRAVLRQVLSSSHVDLLNGANVKKSDPVRAVEHVTGVPSFDAAFASAMRPTVQKATKSGVGRETASPLPSTFDAAYAAIMSQKSVEKAAAPEGLVNLHRFQSGAAQ